MWSRENTNVGFCGYTPEDGYTQEECDTKNKAHAMYVAKVILEQLGGSAALKMAIGAHQFTSHHDEGRGALSFRFKGSRKVNYLKIILAASDTYSLRFIKVGKTDHNVVVFSQDIYCDQLHDIFRNVTGLETRVPRIVGVNA